MAEELTEEGCAIGEVQASEDNSHLARLPDEVERGETLLITRHGRPIARLVPKADRREEEIDRAAADIRALRRRTGLDHGGGGDPVC